MHIQFISLVIPKHSLDVCIEACQTCFNFIFLLTLKASSLLSDFNPSLFPSWDRTGLYPAFPARSLQLFPLLSLSLFPDLYTRL